MWMPMFTLALLCFVNLAVGSQPEHKQRERRSSGNSDNVYSRGIFARLQTSLFMVRLMILEWRQEFYV